MEPYTLDRSFHKRDIIDEFNSIIWIERYYGDNSVELSVPATTEMIAKLPVGTFIGVNDSDTVMILETFNIENNVLKLTGIGILPWLNNRFIRTSALHEDRYWYITDQVPGEILWTIVYNMCVVGSPYLNGTINIGILGAQRFGITGLTLDDYDKSGSTIKIGVPFGPVYDALKEIATTYEIGMQIKLLSVSDTSYSLGFRSYKGIDRTSNQTDNPRIRFSPQLDSLTDIKELQSIAAFKTLVYAFAPGLNPAEGETDLRSDPGESILAGSEYTGFDLRALQIFAEDITTDMVGANSDNLLSILNSRAQVALMDNPFVEAVDGEIVPDSQVKYGLHYNLGDLIEVQGNSGAIKTSRVTEYIRSQDSTGERAYPTVTMIS